MFPFNQKQTKCSFYFHLLAPENQFGYQLRVLWVGRSVGRSVGQSVGRLVGREAATQPHFGCHVTCGHVTTSIPKSGRSVQFHKIPRTTTTTTRGSVTPRTCGSWSVGWSRVGRSAGRSVQFHKIPTRTTRRTRTRTTPTITILASSFACRM